MGQKVVAKPRYLTIRFDSKTSLQNLGEKECPMPGPARFITVAAICMAISSNKHDIATAADTPVRLPRENLLVYRGADGRPVAVKTPLDWEKRRAEVVR